jgi:RimJ/RimL family protein N-acetyltransferase
MCNPRRCGTGAHMTQMLHTARLVLRTPTSGDWPTYRAFMDSTRAKAFKQQGDIGAIWRSFAAELGHWQMFDCGMWAVTKRGDDTAVALIGPWTPPDWPENEIGWMVFDQNVEGTGIATEAARAAVNHAFGVLGWKTAVSYIHPDNTRSIRLAEKLGALHDSDAKVPVAYHDNHVWRHLNHEADQ